MELRQILILTFTILNLPQLISMEPLNQNLKLVSTHDSQSFSIPRSSAEEIDSLSQIISDLSIESSLFIDIPSKLLNLLTQLIKKEHTFTRQSIHLPLNPTQNKAISLCEKIGAFFLQFCSTKSPCSHNQSLFNALNQDMSVQINRLPLKEKVDLYKHAHRIGCDEIAAYILYLLRMPMGTSDPLHSNSNQLLSPNDARTYWNEVYTYLGTETRSIKSILEQQKNSRQPLQSLMQLNYTFDQLKDMGILKMVATTSLDGTVTLWDSIRGKMIQSYTHQNSVPHKAIHGAIPSPDLKKIATFSLFNLHIWNLITGKKLHTLDHFHSISNVQFSPDSTKIITLTSDGAANVFDAQSGLKIYTLHANPRIHDEAIYAVSFSANSAFLITTSKYGIKKLLHSNTGERITKLQSRHLVNDPVLSNDNTQLATTEDNAIIIWDIYTREKNQTIQQSNASSVQFTKDNTKLITTINGTNFVTIWDIATGRKIATLEETTWPKNNPLNSKKLSPDGELHLQAINESNMQLSNITTRSILNIIGHKNPNKKIISTKFSPDSTKLVIVAANDSRCTNMTLTIWNTKDGKKKWRYVQSDWILKIRFSADSQQLLVMLDSNKAYLLDCTTGKLLAEFEHTKKISSTLFIND